MQFYFDDEDGGLRPDTSQPRFVELVPESFFDEGDDFTPFGNDDGHDVLRELEDWYRQRRGTGDPTRFFSGLLRSWDFGLTAAVLGESESKLLARIDADEMNEVYLLSIARAAMATAIGQLKITGSITPPVAALGLRGVRVARLLFTRAGGNPNWPYQADALAGVAEIERVIQASPEA